MEKTMKRATIFTLTICFAVISLPSTSSRAQVQEPAENRGAADAWRSLLRLRTTATALHITAHPDDEDGAMLTWLSRAAGVRVGLLTLNRGEGGANLVGPELYDTLGILRTEELLVAGRYYGIYQMFTRVTDFGFSKRLDETLEHWGREVVLGDVVHAIRMYRPDIIVSRFHGKQRDGNGHHQTAGLMSIEAFKAAADPNRFPEHLTEGLRPWQVKKLYLSVRESEQIATLKIDVGAYDPLVGKSYREIARDGLSHQRSQGAGQAHAAPGSSLSGVMLADSAIPKVENEKSIFDGIDTTILGIAKLTGSTNFSPELTEISNRVEAAISKFDALKPWVVVSDLAAGTKATRALIEKVKASSPEPANKDHVLFLLGNKAQEFNDAMNKALGLVMEALVDPERASGGPASFFALRETFNVAIPGQRFSLTLSVTNRSPVQLEKGEADIARTQGWEVTEKTPAGALPVNNSTLRAQFEAKVPDNAEYTRPHWSRANEWRDYIYQINKPQYLHLPFAP